MADVNPLIKVYGENVFDLLLKEVKQLAINSNIPFDKKYIDLGMSFLMLKAIEVAEGRKTKCSLQALVSESFGEAAIYKYNGNGGVL